MKRFDETWLKEQIYYSLPEFWVTEKIPILIESKLWWALDQESQEEIQDKAKRYNAEILITV